MRTGTFLCWLFGHKFFLKTHDDVTQPGVRIVDRHFTNHCIRCGISRYGIASDTFASGADWRGNE